MLRYVIVCALFCIAALHTFHVRSAETDAKSPPNPDADLLAEKEKEFKQLQSEIAELRTRLGLKDLSIIVHCDMYEVRRDVIDAWAKADEEKKKAGAKVAESTLQLQSVGAFLTEALPPEDSLPAQLEAWAADPTRPARRVARSTISTIPGKPAQLHLGEEFPTVFPEKLENNGELPVRRYIVNFRKMGMQLDAVTELRPDGSIHLDVRPRRSEIAPERGLNVMGHEIPGLRVFECRLSLVCRPGQYLALGIGEVRRRRVSNGATQPAVGEEYDDMKVIALIKAELGSTQTGVASVERQVEPDEPRAKPQPAARSGISTPTQSSPAASTRYRRRRG